MKNSEKKHKTPSKVLRIIMFSIMGLFLAVLFGLVFGFVIKYLWNAVLVQIFDIRVITYWQAVGLSILCKLLFGGFHPHHDHHSSNKIDRARYREFRYVHDIVQGNHREFSQYWDNEGREAFKEYLARKKNEQREDEPEKE